MTKREQLIKLLWDAIHLREGICRIIGRRRVEEIADYLLKNGVVISVRCKDCKHSIWCEEEQMWKCVYSAVYEDDVEEWFSFVEYNEADYFCAHGERKDND